MNEEACVYICDPLRPETTRCTRAMLEWLAKQIDNPAFTKLVKLDATSMVLRRVGGLFKFKLCLRDHEAFTKARPFSKDVSRIVKEGYREQVGIEIEAVGIHVQT